MADANNLIAAIRADDSSAVRAAIAADPELARSRDQSGVSVICLAVYLGREGIARVLARVRDDLDVFEASTLGQADRVHELISSTPELVNSYSPDGFHPLGYACFFGRRELFELLLRSGADLEAPARNPMQVRPLHSAVAHADPDLALLLAAAFWKPARRPTSFRRGASLRSMRWRSGGALSWFVSSCATEPIPRRETRTGTHPPSSLDRMVTRKSRRSWSWPSSRPANRAARAVPPRRASRGSESALSPRSAAVRR